MKFTIIVPIYNSASTINLPLNSLEDQTFKDFEVLLINDGSEDSTHEIAREYLDRNKNWRWINKPNGNWGSVINFVIKKKLASGEYITILDSDDWFNNEILKKVSARNEEVVVTDIKIKRHRQKHKEIKVYFSKSGKQEKNRMFTPISVPHGKFYKNELFHKAIELKEGAPYQDTVLFNDLINKGKTFYYIDIPLATWWIDRPGNSTQDDWDFKRAKIWLETCVRVSTIPYGHDESISWCLMYLWELGRKYKGKIPFKINLDTRKAKFLWLPKGTRTISKIYFLIKTRKFRY